MALRIQNFNITGVQGSLKNQNFRGGGGHKETIYRVEMPKNWKLG